MKIKGFALLALASIIAAGCSLQGEAQSQKTVVINEDVQLESSLADSHLEVSRMENIPIQKAMDLLGYRGFRGDKLYYNYDGSLYLYDTKTKEETMLASEEAFAISESGTRALSLQQNQVYVHSLKDGGVKPLTIGSSEDFYFVDPEGATVADYDYKTSSIDLMNVETNERTTYDFSKIFKLENFMLSSIKKIGGEVYCVASSSEDDMGIYRLINQETAEKVLSFPGKEDSIAFYDFLSNDSIIFNGTYNGKEGIFLFEPEKNKVQQLIAGGKDQEGRWTPFYLLSPDGSKIMFDMPVQVGKEYKTNVYMAELVDGALANTIRIMENADLYAVISLSGHWSEDSKTAYIATSIDKSESIADIAIFNVK